MALIDLVKGKDIPTPSSGPKDNIPLDRPRVDGIKFSTSTGKISQAKEVNPLGNPEGRHLNNGRDVLPQGSPLGRHLENGRDVLPQGNPSGRHINSGKTILPQGSPIDRHINSGNTILPQGSPQGRHLQSPLGKGSLNKSPLAGE